MNNSQDHSSKIKSIIITTLVGILCILALWLNLTLEQNSKNKPLQIEIAMLQESNYGATSGGDNGAEEPAPTKSTTAPVQQETFSPSESKKTERPASKISPPVKTKTQETPKKRPSVSPEKNAQRVKSSKQSNTTATQKNNSKKSTSSGNQEANAAMAKILGGKGTANTNGQGDGTSKGNVGDPKGNSDSGSGIGENWKTRVPQNQSHNCEASGTVIVDIVVNANGSIKRATPRVTKSQCLANRAKELVLKYVTAYPGAEGRRGSYKVTLK